MCAAIHIIAQKQVIVVLDILTPTSLVWRPVELHKTHQIRKLAMNVPENLNRSLHAQQNWLFFDNILKHGDQTQDMIGSEFESRVISTSVFMWLH